MDDGTMTSDPAHWHLAAVETARKHPLAVGVWLAADALIDVLIGLQDTVEARLRRAVEATELRTGE